MNILQIVIVLNYDELSMEELPLLFACKCFLLYHDLRPKLSNIISALFREMFFVEEWQAS